MTVISGRIHKDNLAEYYPLFIQAVLSPAFRQEDLDRIKSETIDYLENGLRYSSDEELAKSVLYETIFAGTPYGHIPAGHVKSVKSITLDDVREFYCEHFTRKTWSWAWAAAMTRPRSKSSAKIWPRCPMAMLSAMAARRVRPADSELRRRRSRSRFMACK